jgi:hypothetical protein
MAAAPPKRQRLAGPEPGLVSVCLPVHNCEDYLDECLASILGAQRCLVPSAALLIDPLARLSHCLLLLCSTNGREFRVFRQQAALVLFHYVQVSLVVLARVSFPVRLCSLFAHFCSRFAPFCSHLLTFCAIPGTDGPPDAWAGEPLRQTLE